jgi:hypothetical protein
MGLNISRLTKDHKYFVKNVIWSPEIYGQDDDINDIRVYKRLLNKGFNEAKDVTKWKSISITHKKENSFQAKVHIKIVDAKRKVFHYEVYALKRNDTDWGSRASIGPMNPKQYKEFLKEDSND